MKKFYSLLVCAIVALTSMTASADWYLVGAMNGWNPSDANLKFTDNGDGTFVLELNQTFDADTEFKVCDGTWNLSYGQATDSNIVNPGVLYPVNSVNAANLVFPAGTEVKTITFNPTQATVLVNDLELYLRGEVSGASWDAVDDWKFTKESQNVYTLANKTLKGGFKIADKEWQKANWGITGTANPVLGTEYAMTQNGGDLSISETYCSKITVTLDNNGGATLLLEQKVPELVITGYEGYFTATCEDGIALGAEDVVNSTNNRLEDWDSWKSSWTTEIVSDTEIKLVPTGDLTTAEDVPPFYLYMEAGYFVLNPNGTKTLSSKLSGYNLNMTVPATPIVPADPIAIVLTDPADNAEVESFKSLYVKFNMDVDLYSHIAIPATSEDGLNNYQGTATYTSAYDDATIEFPESFAPGKYTIAIPAGVFYQYQNEENILGETIITITVKEPAPAVEVPTYTAQDYTSLIPQALFRGNHALVDMNNDGKLDLMYKGRDVANGWATVIQVAVSDGSKFTSTVDLPDNDGCSWSRQIYAIDYNNDGYMDYILGQSWGYAQLFKNNGDMTFTRVDEFTTEPFLVETRDLNDETIEIFGSNLLAVADFNMDGWKDIVSMTESKPVLYTNNSGNGTFTRQDESGIAPTRNGTVSVGDYNNDGYPDLLVNGWNDTVGNHCLQINKNNGNGTFTTINFDFNLGLHGSEKGTSIFVDVNGDGLLDVFCTGESMSNGWAKIANVYVNNGDDTFTASTSLASSAKGNADWCDLNGDGLTDIVYAGETSDGAKVNVVINAGNGTFVENTSLVSGVQSGAVVEVADYNGDGMPDIIAEGYGEPCFAIYNGSTSVANQAPVAPTSLVMTEGESNVTFTWQAGSDAETPETALRYNIYVKKTDGTVVTLVNADTETGTLRVADVNASLTTCSYTLNINASDIVAWGVQTIDQAKTASVFATQIVKVPEMVITGHEGYITVSCADGIALGAEEVVGNVDNHLEDSYNWESFFTTEVVSETEIKLIPTEDITTAEPPFYLCLVEGFFVLDPNGTKTLSKTLEYYEVDMTIPAEPLTIAYTYPADNAEVESFNNLYIMFNVGDNGIGLYANIAITATSEDGLTTYTGYADYTQDSYQDANVTFAESFAPGKYTITIPAGVFYDYDNKASKNEETKITITVIEPVVSYPMAVVETNPADGASVESFKYMWIKFNMEYGYNSEAEITAVNVNDATVTYAGYPLFYEDWDEEYNQATLEFAESFAPGTYEITIPAGTFWEYGNESNTLGETKFTITVIEPVSGIAGIVADSGVYVVYNLQGVKLMETENVDDLNKLSEGFYIINGSKVAIRK